MENVLGVGRRWVLRACGHALFSDVVRRYEVGVAAFEPRSLVQNWETRLELVRDMAGSISRVRKISLNLKVFNTTGNRFLEDLLLVTPFAYVAMLAESRGFRRVVGALGLVWERAISDLQGLMGPGWEMGWSFQDLWAFQTPDFGFRPLEVFAGVDFPPAKGLMTEVYEMGRNRRFDVNTSLGKAIRWILGTDLIGTLFLIKFIQLIHHSSAVESEFTVIRQALGCL